MSVAGLPHYTCNHHKKYKYENGSICLHEQNQPVKGLSKRDKSDNHLEKTKTLRSLRIDSYKKRIEATNVRSSLPADVTPKNCGKILLPVVGVYLGIKGALGAPSVGVLCHGFFMFLRASSGVPSRYLGPSTMV